MRCVHYSYSTNKNVLSWRRKLSIDSDGSRSLSGSEFQNPDRWASDREGPTAERARVVAGNDNLMAAGGS